VNEPPKLYNFEARDGVTVGLVEDDIREAVLKGHSYDPRLLTKPVTLARLWPQDREALDKKREIEGATR